MNKKLIVFLLILSLTLFLPLFPANAAAKAGTSCKTVGITSVASGKTFTCVKSGKKLVWDNGVSKSLKEKMVSRVNYKPYIGQVSIEKIAAIPMPIHNAWRNLPNSTAYQIKLLELTGYIEFYSDLRMKVGSDFACWQYSHLKPVNPNTPKSYQGFASGKANESVMINNRDPNFYCELVDPNTIEFSIVWKPTHAIDPNNLDLVTSGVIVID